MSRTLQEIQNGFYHVKLTENQAVMSPRFLTRIWFSAQIRLGIQVGHG